MEKRCKACSVTKDISEFYPVRTRNTTDHICKECRKADSNARWAAKTPEQKYDAQRNTRLKQRYGITLDEYNERLERQGSRCAICPKPAAENPHGVLHVDHNHETGVVRGLLCVGCNSALGYIEHGLFDEFMEYIKNDGVM